MLITLLISDVTLIDVTIGTEVVTMSATDPDQGASLVYFMESPRLAFDPQEEPVDPSTIPNFDVSRSLHMHTCMYMHMHLRMNVHVNVQLNKMLTQSVLQQLLVFVSAVLLQHRARQWTGSRQPVAGPRHHRALPRHRQGRR